MSLKDYNFKPDYNKAFDNIAEDFYIPCMENSSSYDRISGYFGSTIYIIAWTALRSFVANKGKMRIICSPCLTEEDQNAIEKGYAGRTDTILQEALLREISEMFANDYLSSPYNALACLIANQTIDIKLAIPKNETNPEVKRLFHDKVGVFSDIENNSVGFRGPMNETFKGLSSDGNLESIDVFPSWEDGRDAIRLTRVKQYFELLWNKSIDNVEVYDLPESIRNDMISRARKKDLEILIDEVTSVMTIAEKWRPSKSSNSKKPRHHQITALENWEKNNQRGIFEHATGSGKTFTAMCAIRKCLDQKKVVLVLVPSTDLLKQWHKELKNTLIDIDVAYLLCGDGHSEWKQSGLLESWSSNSGCKNRIILATMDTAAGDSFLSRLTKGNHIMIVADEVHRIGSPFHRRIFSINAGPRLGLSATPKRYGDVEGTAALFDYFGGIVPPIFSLKDAIDSDVLTKYFYYPLPLYLSSTEQELWDVLTKEINVLIARLSSSTADKAELFTNKRLQMKLIERSRIVKNASGKTQLALDTIKANYKKGQKWIIYCDNKNQLDSVLSLLLKNNYDAYAYHSEMEGDRSRTLDYFALNGGILVSIKCLDEGVDIPSTTHALILASSKNPREFIQRRGRILRKAEGKHFAFLYDAITIPNKESEDIDRSKSIIASELVRAIQFGEWAQNPACIAYLKMIAIDCHIDFEKTITEGSEEDEGE